MTHASASNIEWRTLGELDLGVSHDLAHGIADWRDLKEIPHLKVKGRIGIIDCSRTAPAADLVDGARSVPPCGLPQFKTEIPDRALWVRPPFISNGSPERRNTCSH